MKITCSKHTKVQANQEVQATQAVQATAEFEEDFDYGSDPEYLNQLADAIEECLLTEFDTDASAWSDGGCIHITMDIDAEDMMESLITENDLIGLTGDPETDAYGFAEEFYTSI